MFWIDVLSRVVHVATAIVLLGGSVYSLFVVRPVLASQSEDNRKALASQLIKGWKRFVHGGILLFLASGFYNYFRAMPDHKGDGLYHALVGIKILVGLVIFFTASALVGRSSSLQVFRHPNGWALKMICILGFIVVMISGYLKVKP
jgi:uncharacterized membrane protein